ncbi:hypothetical protein R6Q59_004111 [Mikania micrantha]
MGRREHSCVHLIGVSPLVGLRDTGFLAGHAVLKAESGNAAKHEKACLKNQHVFTPFAFDTFGFLAPEAMNFLNRVQRVMYSNITAPRHQKIVFSMIGFAIQKEENKRYMDYRAGSKETSLENVRESLIAISYWEPEWFSGVTEHEVLNHKYTNDCSYTSELRFKLMSIASYVPHID